MGIMSSFEFEETYRTTRLNTKRKRKEFKADEGDADAAVVIDQWVKRQDELELPTTNEQNTNVVKENEDEKKENAESNAMSTSYSNVVRKGGQLRLKIKNKSSKKYKMISLKRAIDKKAKNKRIKIKTGQGVKK